MDKFTKLLVVMTAACFLLIACGAEENLVHPTPKKTEENLVHPTPKKIEEEPLVVTPGIKENLVNLKVGGTFEIQIPTIPTAGFEWEPEDLDTTILLQEGGANYVADTSSNSAGGIVTLKFKAIGPGKTTLNLIYTQPSGNGTPSFSKNSLAVTVNVN